MENRGIAGGQKREIAMLRGEFTEQVSSLREQLAIVKEAQEALMQQLADANGAQQRENTTRTARNSGKIRREWKKVPDSGGNKKSLRMNWEV
jgi:hypothetical protein